MFPIMEGFQVSQKLLICERRFATFAFHNWGTALETVVDALIGSCFPRKLPAGWNIPQYAHRDPRVMYPFPLSDELAEAPFLRRRIILTGWLRIRRGNKRSSLF